MKTYRDASERMIFELQAEASQYRELVSSLVQHFGLEPIGEMTRGLDEVFQDFRKDNVHIGLEWDIWTSFTVVAKSTDAEPLVLAIAEYLSKQECCDQTS